MITVQNLDFYYDDTHQALYQIQVQLNEGSITGLIGPNGAGKSTLMRCMAGLEIPSNGTVLLDGHPILDNPRHSFSKIGYLPDFFGLPSDLTVIQCLTYAAKSRGIADHELPKVLEKTVQSLNLQHKLYNKIKNLSRGQKQRVGIGQVIVHQPRFLLLDEPASGLDPEARHELSLLLRQLQAQGMTILVSSHILSELDEYCTHMLVIKNGRIQAHQALHDEHAAQQTLLLQFSPSNEQIAALLQSLPNVQSVLPQNQGFAVVLPAGEAARVDLLRHIVQAALPLSEAQIVKTSLLQSYQNSLNIQGARDE